MAQNLKACVIQIRDRRGHIHGTGFLIENDMALTCAHVIENVGGAPGESVPFVFALNGETGSAQVLADGWRDSDGDDIAFLRLQSAPPDGAVPAILGRGEGTRGHAFEAFGYPRVGHINGLGAGGQIVRLVDDQATGAEMLQLRSQEIDLGMSGAPVLDLRDDLVVGMVRATYIPRGTPKFEDTAFATPMETVNKAWPTTTLVDPPTTWERLRRRPKALLLMGLGVALIALLVVAVVLFLSQGIQQARQPGGLLSHVYPAPTATLTPRPDGGFNIAVAQFATLDNDPSFPVSSQASQDLSAWIFTGIKDEAMKNPDLNATVWGPDEVGIIHGEDRDTRAANAARFAMRYNANLVIYGTITGGNDTYSVQPEFYVSWQGFEYGSEVVGPDRLGQPVTFTLPIEYKGVLQGVSNELKARRRALQHVVIGLNYFYVNDYDDAWAKFYQASVVEQDQGREVIHLLMGAAKLLVYEQEKSDPEQRTQLLVQVSEEFTKAYQLNPDYARSYLGLGAVTLQQATILNEVGNVEDVDPVKLTEAEGWYSKSLSASDQPATAYVPIKAAYGRGQSHLVGYEFRVPGWSADEARRFFNQVISAYDPDQAPELTWYVGTAHAFVCRLDGLEEYWSAMSSGCRRAIQILSSELGDSARVWNEVALYWVWVACAEQKLGRLERAWEAYDQAIQIGRGYVSANELEEWQFERDNLEIGGPCRGK